MSPRMVDFATAMGTRAEARPKIIRMFKMLAENVQFFACTKEDQTPNTMLLSAAKDYNCWKLFVKNYKLGNVYFESLKIKQATQELLRIMLIK